MDKDTFLKRLKRERTVIEVNATGKMEELEFVSMEDYPNIIIFKDENGEMVSKVLDDNKLDTKMIGSKFFFNPENALSYCNQLYCNLFPEMIG